jgi:hypothetical protein
MRSNSFWAIAAALALTAGARAEDSYTLKLKQTADVGKTITVKNTDSTTAVIKITDADGKAVGTDMKKTQKDEEVYTETVLARGDNHATKYKRTYEKATRTVDGKAAARSFEGLTLLFEEKDGKFTVTVEGNKPVDKDDLADLTRKANEADEVRDEVLLPTKPVKVGDTWKVDGKTMSKAFAKTGGLNAEHSGAEGKLVKAYKKDGRQYGVIEMTLKVAPATTPPGVKFDAPPVIEMKLTLDTTIDGSSTAGVLSMTGGGGGKATVEQNGKKFTVENRADLTGKKEQSAEK